MIIQPVVPRRQAERDVQEAIQHYLAEAGAKAALGFIDALQGVYARIARHPASGSPRYAHELDLPGLRFARPKRSRLSMVLFPLMACSTGISGQDTQLASSNTHTHKLAGFAGGVTLGAAVMSLDAVMGSGCTGSGDYLLMCRAAFVGGSLVAGGLGALGGAFVRTDGVRGRSTRILVGSALGAVGAFVMSTVACRQADDSNPAILCGYDGMVETAPVVVAAATGATVGALTGRRVESPQMIRLAPVPGRGIGLFVTAPFPWRPR